MISARLAYLIERILHWSAALLIVYMLFSMGTQIHNVDWTIKGEQLHKQDAISAHLIQGFVLVFLVLARLIWNRVFPYRDSKMVLSNNWHKYLVYGVHACMLMLLLGFIGSGILMLNHGVVPIDFLSFVFPAQEVDQQLYFQAYNFHGLMEDTFYVLLFVHIAGGLRNHR